MCLLQVCSVWVAPQEQSLFSCHAFSTAPRGYEAKWCSRTRAFALLAAGSHAQAPVIIASIMGRNLCRSKQPKHNTRKSGVRQTNKFRDSDNAERTLGFSRTSHHCVTRAAHHRTARQPATCVTVRHTTHRMETTHYHTIMRRTVNPSLGSPC